MLQSGASFCHIFSVASNAPVRGTGFTPGRSSPGARDELHSAPDAPIRGVMYLTLFAVFGSPTPQRALLRAGFARCGGGTRAPGGGGASCLGVGHPGSGAHPPPTTRPLGRAPRARFPLVVGAVCESGGPADLGTLSRAAVRHVLCALPGFAAPGGQCGLAPVLVPWLWPAACLSGVPSGPALVRRSSSRPVALGAPVGFPVAVVPSPTPGAVAPGSPGWLRGARGGRPRTGLIVPAAGPCRGKGAGRAPRRTRSEPCDGVVPGGSLWLRSWAACAAVVGRVWARSLTRPVCCTIRFSTGDSAGEPGLVRVDAVTAPFGSEDATPGSRACVCACSSWLGRASRPPGRVLVRFTFPLAVLGVLFGCSAPSGQGLPRLWLLLGFWFFLFFFSLPPPCCAPVVSCLASFPAPGALGLGVLSPPPPPPFFFPPPPSLRPIVSCFSCFPASGALGLGLLFPPPSPPPFFLFVFCPPPPPLSLAFPAFWLPWAFAPPPLFFSLLFFFVGCAVRGGFVRLWPSGVPACASVVLSLSLLCVRWLVLCGAGCWAWLSCAVSWGVLVSCFGGAVIVWPRGSPPCGSAWCVLVFRCPVFCSVALCCRVVVCCRALRFVWVVACACCLFLAAACLLCVFWGVLLCVACPLRPVRCCAALCWCPFVVLCASSVLFLVAGVVGSRCRCLLLGVCWWLWLPGVVVWWCVSALVPVSGPAVAQWFPCSVLLPCAAVWFCAVVPCLLLLFFSLLVALVSCCSPLVLGPGPVPGRFCFCALPVRPVAPPVMLMARAL